MTEKGSYPGRPSVTPTTSVHFLSPPVVQYAHPAYSLSTARFSRVSILILACGASFGTAKYFSSSYGRTRTCSPRQRGGKGGRRVMRRGTQGFAPPGPCRARTSASTAVCPYSSRVCVCPFTGI